MVTKQQHYYPRSFIKHFSNKDGKVFSYISHANKVRYINYEKICSANYTYEDGIVVDNILENKFSIQESKVAPIINNIIKYIRNEKKRFDISEEEIEYLFQYMMLQYVRTDSGRINLIRGAGNKNYSARKYPMELDEIKDNSSQEILKFNRRFKQDEAFKSLLKLFSKPKGMNFHISIGKNFITSDNPVIVMNQGKQICMPISPDIYIIFQDDSINCSENIIVTMTDEKNRYLNECQVETANYFVISNTNFDFVTNCYLYNRFHKKDWAKNSRHFN